MEVDPSNFKACVKALAGAFSLSCRALQVELAVSLYVFHKLDGPTNVAKRDLRQVYADAGRPCLSYEDASYQTVMRRIGRSAALFDKIGAKKIARAVGESSGAGAIAALVDLLAAFNLQTMDDVGMYVGHMPKVKVDTPRPHNRRAVDDPEVTHIKTRHIDVAVPPGTPAKELVALANKLLKIAETM